MINWIFNYVAISINAVSVMIGKRPARPRLFISDDGNCQTRRAMFYAWGFRDFHTARALIFLLSEAMTSFDVRLKPVNGPSE